MQYRVVGEIDLDAEFVEDAALQTLEIQRDATSIATCFIVTDETGTRQEVDLGCACLCCRQAQFSPAVGLSAVG